MNQDMQKSVDIIISAGELITMNRERESITRGAVALKGNIIVGVGMLEVIKEQFDAADYLDEPDGVLLPGFINGHTHMGMSLLRGVADDVPLQQWLAEYILPLEKQFVDAGFVQCGTTLAVLEMLRCGITTCADMYWHASTVATVCDRLGIRAVLGSTVTDDREQIVQAVCFMEEWQHHARIVPAIAPHSLVTVPEELLYETGELAKEYDLPLLMHVAETAHERMVIKKRYGIATGALLERMGLLSSRAVYAHAVHFEPEEIEALQQAEVGLIHCPTSNLKLGAGIAPLYEYIRSGCRVGLGTDGAASNNSLDIVAEMKMATLLQRYRCVDKHMMSALQAVECATIGGAQALHMEAEIGSIEVGKKADLITIRCDHLHQLPCYEPLSTLVYASRATDVSTVIVDGVILVRNGFFACDPSLLEHLYSEVMRYRKHIAKACHRML